MESLSVEACSPTKIRTLSQGGCRKKCSSPRGKYAILYEISMISLLWRSSILRRVSFCVVRKNLRSKEFSRHDDSIPYLDNAKLILFLTTQNETRLSGNSPLLRSLLKLVQWTNEKTQRKEMDLNVVTLMNATKLTNCVNITKFVSITKVFSMKITIGDSILRLVRMSVSRRLWNVYSSCSWKSKTTARNMCKCKWMHNWWSSLWWKRRL